MYKIAIVDDEKEPAQHLKECLECYAKEYGEQFMVDHFKSGINFLDDYSPDYDLVFMDVDMPYMNGIQTAKELRKKDATVPLMFVTVLAKYAIKGYEVSAIDYVLKPVSYNTFKLKIKRALQAANRRQKLVLSLPMGGELPLRIEASELDSIEIEAHEITYHTTRGDYKTYGTMRAIEKILPSNQFFQCNRCFIVNLRNIVDPFDDTITIGKQTVTISRSRKKAFMEALNRYYLSSSRIDTKSDF